MVAIGRWCGGLLERQCCPECAAFAEFGWYLHAVVVSLDNAIRQRPDWHKKNRRGHAADSRDVCGDRVVHFVEPQPFKFRLAPANCVSVFANTSCSVVSLSPNRCHRSAGTGATKSSASNDKSSACAIESAAMSMSVSAVTSRLLGAWCSASACCMACGNFQCCVSAWPT